MNIGKPSSKVFLRIYAKMMDSKFKTSPKRGLSPGLQVAPRAAPLLSSVVESSGTS